MIISKFIKISLVFTLCKSTLIQIHNQGHGKKLKSLSFFPCDYYFMPTILVNEISNDFINFICLTEFIPKQVKARRHERICTN